MKLAFMTLLIQLYSITSSVNTDDNINIKQLLPLFEERGYSKSIYYSTFLKANNITGTGNLLKDSLYRTLCDSMTCPTGCCDGEINVIRCGTQTDCDSYITYVTAWKIAIIVVFSIFGIFIILVIGLGLIRKHKNRRDNIELALFIMSILLFFPISIISWLLCSRKDGTKPKRAVNTQ
jgi:hypothetical protein